jgi:hypothetical protein
MTIIAGFRYGHGVLLCADSEYTYGSEMKFRGTKLFPYEFASNGGSKAIFGLSGSVPYAKMAIGDMARALADSPRKRMSLAGMYKTLREELAKFHRIYVHPHPFYGRGDGAEFSLIVGLWSVDGGLGLYESSDAALNEISEPVPLAVAGSGATFARYVASPLVRHDKMSLMDVMIAATYAIKEAKDNVPGCGYGSELLSLTDAGEISNVGWIKSSEIEELTEGFDQAIRHLFLTTCDLDSTEKQMSQRFEGMWAVIQAVREHLKAENKKVGSAMAELIADLHARRIKKL